MKLTLDLTGTRFGFLTVVCRHGSTDRMKAAVFSTWLCQCDCGELVVVSRRDFHRGKRYCSVRRHKADFLQAVMSGRSPASGLGHELTYASWNSMRMRCKPLGKYGLRGISVCDRWSASFKDFLVDMGDRPSKAYSIDRIDTKGNYEPGNCRWATRLIQQSNRTNTRWVFWRGERWKLVDVVAAVGGNINTLGSRLKMGWDLERAIRQPVKRYKIKPVSPVEREIAALAEERWRRLMGG